MADLALTNAYGGGDDGINDAVSDVPTTLMSNASEASTAFVSVKAPSSFFGGAKDDDQATTRTDWCGLLAPALWHLTLHLMLLGSSDTDVC